MHRGLPDAARIGLRVLIGTVLAVATIAGIALVGLTASAADMHRNGAADRPVAQWPAPKPVPAGRTVVAVVLGTTGSVVTDVLAPYEVFARSDAFSVYTVAATRTPLGLTGGLPVLPDYSFDQVGSAAVPRPDVVVVPALADPTGAAEAPLRAWVAEQARRGTRILGVCSGSIVLAAAGILDGRQATSFWERLDALERDYPAVHWVRGQRYVQDGAVTTTAGVSSGVVGALRLVEQLAGRAEAVRVGTEVSYPQWSLDATTGIAVNRLVPADLPYAVNALFPWGRPTIGIGLVEGVGEIDVAAVFELYAATSSAARARPVAGSPVVRTRHGVALLPDPVDAAAGAVDRVLVPGVRDETDVDGPLRRWAADRGLALELPHRGQAAGEFGFDPVLRDLARNTDRATARVAAKFTEYPGPTDLAGPSWPWRATILLAVTVLLGLAAGVVGTHVLGRVAPWISRRRARSSAPTTGAS